MPLSSMPHRHVLFPVSRIGLICCLIIAGGLCFTPESGRAASSIFQSPPELEPARNFWVRTFAEWSQHEVAFHDRMYMDVVYEVINIQKETGKQKYTDRQKSAVLKKYFAKYRDMLKALHRKRNAPDTWTAEERRVAALFDHVSGDQRFAEAAKLVRAQTGLREKFLDGLKRQGQYIDAMKAIFQEEGVPEELTALPHVESSFNTMAVSRYRAVGLWQFMYRTGRSYMRIDKYIDERRDPIYSTRAVARLFKDAYQRLGSWPLAVMAHNHGLNGMRRAVQQVNTRDVATIIDKYKSRSFGFASRNFYPEFLAVLDIQHNVHQYFPQVTLQAPTPVETHKLSTTVRASQITKACGITSATFRDINPGLSSKIFSGSMSIPKGVRIHLPAIAGRNHTEALAALQPSRSTPQRAQASTVAVRTDLTATGPAQPVPPATVSLRQENDYYVTDALSDETLWHYVRWSGISISRLRSANNMSSRRTLRLHQTIRIPLTPDLVADFEARRLAFHKEMEQGFLKQYSVTGMMNHTVQGGENLWEICTGLYEVPFWLVVRYNPTIQSRRLQVGDVLTIPVIRKVS
jgi:hypothetical protein